MRTGPYRSLLLLLLCIFRMAPAQDTSAARPPDADSLALPLDSSLTYVPPPFWGEIFGNSARKIVLPADSVRWLSHRNVAEALAQTGSIGLSEPTTAGGYAQFHLRGTDHRGVGYLLDGRPLNDPGSGILNPDHLQAEDAARFEIVTGPRAFLYGLEHQGAVVNLATREWNANKPYTRIVYAEEGDAYSYTDGTYSQNISRRVGITAGFQHLGASGSNVRTPHQQWNIRGRLRVHLGEGWLASLAERYTATQTDLNGGFDPSRSAPSEQFDPRLAAVVNSDSYERIDRHDLDLGIARISPVDSSATTRLSVYYTDIVRLYRDEENRPEANGVYISSDHRFRRSGIQVSQLLRTGPFRFSAGGGTEEVRSLFSPNAGKLTTWRPSAWGSVDADLSSAFRAGLFARTERYLSRTGSGFGAEISLRLPAGLRVFGGMSLADRLPGLFESEWLDSTITRPATIGPERHQLIEAGVEFNPSSSLSLQTIFFRRTVDDPIEISATAGPSPFGHLLIAPGSRLVCEGVEGGGSFSFWVILLEGNVAYQRLNRDGVVTDRFPRLTARGGIYCRGSFFDGNLDVKAGVRGRYVSSSIGDSFNPEFLTWGTNTEGELAAWSSADAVLSARIGDAQVQIVWENFTDVPAYTAHYELLRGRGVRLGVAWEFLN